MSIFAVELKKISEIKTHTNADNLELGKVEGMEFQFVVKKGQYSIGDSVVYFPIDSILPVELSDNFGVTSFLSKGRVRTVKLRSEISQGLVMPLATVESYLNKKIDETDDLATLLGVYKHEPPVWYNLSGGRADYLVQPPSFVYHYDIEGCDRFPNIVNLLMDQEVYITEKLEGTHFSIAIDGEDTISVCQRNLAILPTEKGREHGFWKVVDDLGLIDRVKNIRDVLSLSGSITLRGEYIGPGCQGNHYGLLKPTVKFFEIEQNGVPVNSEMFFSYFDKHYPDYSVPLLYHGKLQEFLDGKTVQTISNGMSILNNKKLREGIVIKPATEQLVDGFPRDGSISRLIIKQRSPEYLAKTDN